MTRSLVLMPSAAALRRWAIPIALGFLVGLGGCADTRFRSQADTAMERGAYEEALERLQSGLKQHPESVVLRSALVQTRQQAMAILLDEAQRRQTAGDPSGARRALERALALEPKQPRLRALLQDLDVAEGQQAALDEAQRQIDDGRPEQALATVEHGLKSNARHAELLALRRQLEEEARGRELLAARDVLDASKPVSLDFRDAGLRTVLDLISRHSGVNYVVDRDVRPDLRVTLLLQQTPVQEALDLLLATNQLTKKVVDARTILVYPNTPDKAREYQEQVVRVFYLSHGEARGAAAFLRSMLKTGEPFVNERTNMLALRDSPETVRLAERLMALYDASEPEVLLELEVLEVSTRRLTELGVKLPDSFSLTPLPPAGDSRLTLENIANLGRGRVGLGLGGVLINLKREAGDFSTLANPQIRVKHREKAKVLVGDKIPVISTVTGQAGFVSDNITYLDVGLKLDVEPTVHADDDVGIKVSLEVSSLGTAVRTAAGALAYQIGTRSASTWLRLRDGETQLLAGLISKEERTSASRLPGAGDLPVLGRLFSSTADNAQRTELVLAVTPRVLRNIQRPAASEAEVWVGTEARPGLRGPRVLRPSAQRAGASVAPTAQAALAKGQPLVAESAQKEPQPPAVEAPASQRLRWQGPSEIKVGDLVRLELHMSGARELRALPMELGFDPSFWKLEGQEAGELLAQGQAPTSLTTSGQPETGSWGLSVMRQTAGGASGDGGVLTLRLRARRAGETSVEVRSARSVSGSSDVAPLGELPLHRVRISP